MEIVSVLSDLK